MTSQDVAKTFVPKKPILRRSASATNIIFPNLATLNLRDTKSFSGNMQDVKSSQHEAMEKIKRKEPELHFHDGIETKDLYNNEIVVVNADALTHHGKAYNINQIASYWKKDCRMWLWKNADKMLKNRSVGDRVRAHLRK